MRTSLTATLALLLLPLAAAADEFRYFEQGGITYRERIATVQVPVSETQWKEQQVTVYKENFNTQLVDQPRFVRVPVTEYRTEARWHGWWNPFASPHLAYHVVPQTRWETRMETVKTPVNRREFVPEVRTVKVPETNVKMVQQQRVVERVAMTPVAVPAGPMYAAAPFPVWHTTTPQLAPRFAPQPLSTNVPQLASLPPGTSSSLPPVSLAPPPAAGAASGAGTSVVAPGSPLIAVPQGQPRLLTPPPAPNPNVAGASPYSAPPAAREQIGGISRLENDPPRHGQPNPAAIR